MINYKELFEKDVFESLNSPYLKEDYGTRTLNDYRDKTEYKLSHKDKVNKILNFIKNNNVSDEDKKIFNKILGDRSILDKLIFVNDGSYRTQRIFYKRFDYNNSAFYITCEYLYDKDNNIYHKMSKIDILNFIKNNYEIIFIQLEGYERHYNDYILNDYDPWDPIAQLI